MIIMIYLFVAMKLIHNFSLFTLPLLEFWFLLLFLNNVLLFLFWMIWVYSCATEYVNHFSYTVESIFYIVQLQIAYNCAFVHVLAINGDLQVDSNGTLHSDFSFPNLNLFLLPVKQIDHKSTIFVNFVCYFVIE